MKLVIQRCKEANVKIDNKIVGNINKGFVVLLGITHSDTKDNAEYLANKISKLRVFEDENDKMNLSIKDVQGELLIISQFTLYANCNEGNRPSFKDAAEPVFASELYEYFVGKCKEIGINVQKGIFGADMQVSLINDGPCTIILER